MHQSKSLKWTLVWSVEITCFSRVFKNKTLVWKKTGSGISHCCTRLSFYQVSGDNNDAQSLKLRHMGFLETNENGETVEK